MSCLIKDAQLFKNTIKYGIKLAIVQKKNLIANQCTTKTKIKFYNRKIKANFRDNKESKESIEFVFLPVIFD